MSSLGLAIALSTLACCQGGSGLFDTEHDCFHCSKRSSFGELLQDRIDLAELEFRSEVNNLWATHVEVIPLTTDIGGFLPPSFHDRLATEAIAGWRRFRDELAPSLPDHNRLRSLSSTSLNDAFFHFQKNLFEAEGDLEDALRDVSHPNPPPEANSTWPGMQSLPEYNQLREIVAILSRRYLTRAGLRREKALNLNYSIFNWVAVHGPGEFHGPHTHVGEYHVGVFYAQAERDAGKLRFGDPRGQSPPFGKAFFHTPRSGDLVFFPSWLSHMATVTSPTSSKRVGEETEDVLRVVFSFNIGPTVGPLPCHYWWSDPTAEMGFKREAALDLFALGLLDDDPDAE